MKKLWLCSVLVMICGNMFANQGTLSDKGATNDSVIMIVFVAGILLFILGDTVFENIRRKQQKVRAESLYQKTNAVVEKLKKEHKRQMHVYFKVHSSEAYYQKFMDIYNDIRYLEDIMINIRRNLNEIPQYVIQTMHIILIKSEKISGQLHDLPLRMKRMWLHTQQILFPGSVFLFSLVNTLSYDIDFLDKKCMVYPHNKKQNISVWKKSF